MSLDVSAAVKKSEKILGNTFKRDREPALAFYHDTVQNPLIRNTDLGSCSLKRDGRNWHKVQRRPVRTFRSIMGFTKEARE